MSDVIKILRNELNELKKEPSDHFKAEPSEADIRDWTAVIFGPPASPYEGGKFKLSIRFPHNYPFEPPKVQFRTPILHPNISKDGQVCLDILKADSWSPIFTVSKLLLAIVSLLTDPNPHDPLELTVASLYLSNRSKYEELAKELTKRKAM